MRKVVESAEDQFKRLQILLEENPKNIMALTESGVLLFEHFHEDEKAMQYFSKAIKLDPENIERQFWKTG